MAGGADTCEGAAWATTDRGVRPAKAGGLAPYERAPGVLFLTGGAEYVDGGGRAGSDGCGCRLSLLLIFGRRSGIGEGVRSF